MPHSEDSPPEFITIRTPGVAPSAFDVYQGTLALVEHVHAVIEAASVRFHLKDRLDRYTTQIAMRLARAQSDARPNRWRHYRAIVEHLTDVATMLDIIHRQKVTTAVDDLERARTVARQLIAELVIHAQLGHA